jgi:hypothetical protein
VHLFQNRFARIVAVSMIALALLMPAFEASRSVATAQSTAPRQTFRLLAPSIKWKGLDRATLLERAITQRIFATTASLNAKDCAKRPAITKPAGLFLLPGDVGKTLTCTIANGTALLIDFNGGICNESTKAKADVACVEKRLSLFDEYSVQIDGVNLGAGRFKTYSNEFVVDTKDGNAFNLAAGNWKLRAGGWPLIVAGLEAGTHTVVGHYQLGGTNRQTITVTVIVN